MHEKHLNDKGQTISTIDTGDAIHVWDHENGIEIGSAGDPENARQMING